MAYLITQSLISSWSYAHDCREGCEEDAFSDFMNALNRVPKETTPEMQNGIDFENEVYAEASGVRRAPHPKWESGIQTVAKVIRGGQFQVREQRLLTVCGKELLVYGVLDALKAGEIYDVKFSNKSFGSAEFAGKYLDDVVFTKNTVSSVTSMPSELMKVTNSNDVIIVGNTLPSGASVTTPVNSTNTTNLISVSNSWDE